eukprot:140340-Hanusia_phi.AAC.1
MATVVQEESGFAGGNLEGPVMRGGGGGGGVCDAGSSSQPLTAAELLRRSEGPQPASLED